MRLPPLLSAIAISSVAWVNAALAQAAAPVPTRADTTVLVSPSWLADRLGRADIVILYVGPKAEYDGGHIPGARYLSNDAFIAQTHEREHEPSLMTELPPLARLDSVLEGTGVSAGSRIVLYGGPVTTVARLYVTLEHLGLGAQASILDGGLAAWRGEGRPVTPDLPVVTRGSLSLTPRPDVIADLATVRSAAGITMAGEPPSTAPTVRFRPTIVDARAPQFYSGESAGQMPRAGHIPTAVNIPFTTFVESGSRFRTTADLQTAFRAAGIEPGGQVVTYCHIGLQASVAYVAARAAGLQPRMYDGSFDEWSRTPALPVIKP